MQHLTSDTGSKVRQQIQRRAADLVLIDVATQRRIQFVPLHDITEIADAAGGQRLDRTCRNRVDADVVLAQILGDVLHRGFKRRLGQPHHVVMRHHLFRAVIGQRQQGAAIGHHRRRAGTDGGEGINRDIHGHPEIRGAGVDIAATQFVLVGKADGMDHKIKRAPVSLQRRKQRIQRVFLRHITFDHPRHADRRDQRFHPFFQRFALIGKGNLCPGVGTGLGDAPSDGFVVGKPHDQAAFAAHQSIRHENPFQSSRLGSFRPLRGLHQGCGNASNHPDNHHRDRGPDHG